MATVILIIAIIFMIAAVIDWVLREDAVIEWHKSAVSLQNKLEKFSVSKSTFAANELFRGVFDAVYSPKFWSGKRFFRSVVSSVIALFCILLLFGWENTEIGKFTNRAFNGKKELLEIILVLPVYFCINALPDFFSLQETRWVMEKTKQSQNVLLLLFWSLIDILLTITIFYIGWVLIFTLLVPLVGLVTNDISLEFFEFTKAHNAYMDKIFEVRGLLPFFLSTFATSFLWIGFVITVLFISGIKSSSKIISLIIDTIGESQNPARTTAGILCIPIILGFFVVNLSS